MNRPLAVILIGAIFYLTGCAAERPKLDCKAIGDAALADVKSTPDLHTCADNGNPEAEFSLGVIFIAAANSQCVAEHCEDIVDDGFALPAGTRKTEAHRIGLRLVQSAADKNEPRALNELGFAYLGGREGFTQDYEKARALLEKATAAGDNIGPYNLATIYLGGYGVVPSQELGEKYLKLAAERGYVQAWCRLSELEEPDSAARMIGEGVEFMRRLLDQPSC